MTSNEMAKMARLFYHFRCVGRNLTSRASGGAGDTRRDLLLSAAGVTQRDGRAISPTIGQIRRGDALLAEKLACRSRFLRAACGQAENKTFAPSIPLVAVPFPK